jgi:hypothetical protein
VCSLESGCCCCCFWVMSAHTLLIVMHRDLDYMRRLRRCPCIRLTAGSHENFTRRRANAKNRKTRARRIIEDAEGFLVASRSISSVFRCLQLEYHPNEIMLSHAGHVLCFKNSFHTHLFPFKSVKSQISLLLRDLDTVFHLHTHITLTIPSVEIPKEFIIYW